jgi:hypothetical protein
MTGPPDCTEGPWIVCATATRKLMASVVNDSGRTIALVGAIEPDEANANAFLIAAARDLYEALEHILNGSLSLPRFAEDEGRAALAKARGEVA